MSHKLKTNKSAVKRFKIGKKNMMHRTGHQNHFNAKESGEETRSKRGYKMLGSAENKNIRKILPYA